MNKWQMAISLKALSHKPYDLFFVAKINLSAIRRQPLFSNCFSNCSHVGIEPILPK